MVFIVVNVVVVAGGKKRGSRERERARERERERESESESENNNNNNVSACQQKCYELTNQCMDTCSPHIELLLMN